jgi:hypothetical protein
VTRCPFFTQSPLLPMVGCTYNSIAFD